MQQVEMIHGFKDTQKPPQYLKTGKKLTSLNQLHYQLNEQQKMLQTLTLSYDKPQRWIVEI